MKRIELDELKTFTDMIKAASPSHNITVTRFIECTYDWIADQQRKRERRNNPPVHQLRHRVTKKYVGTHQHLDEWEDIPFKATRLSCERIWTAECCGDSWTDMMTLKVEYTGSVDQEFDDEEVYQAIRDTFTEQGCSCEHDCCGCASVTVDYVAQMGTGSDIWTVKLGGYINV